MPLDYSPYVSLENIDADYIKSNYLAGFEFTDDDDEPLPDEFYEERLQNALAVLEEKTGIDVLERVNVGETHDFHGTEYVNYGFIPLYRVPARQVTGIRAVFATGQSSQIFPSDWVRLEQAGAQVNIVATGGVHSQIISGAGGYFPLVWGGSYFPQLWEVDYVSGFPPDKIPRIVADALAKLAVLDLFAALTNFVNPVGTTGQSIAIDGMSQSRSFAFPAFKSQVEAASASLYGIPGYPNEPGLIKQIRDNYFGIPLRAG